MLVIRLARTGKKKQAYFRVVVQEKHKSPGAKFIEILGNYDPHSKKLEVDKEKAVEYMSKGAQPSNSLAILFKKEGIKLPSWVKINEKNRAPKKKDDEDKKDEAKPEAEEKTEEKLADESKEEKVADKNPSTPEVTKDKEEKKDEAKASEPKEDKKDSPKK